MSFVYHISTFSELSLLADLIREVRKAAGTDICRVSQLINVHQYKGTFIEKQFTMVKVYEKKTIAVVIFVVKSKLNRRPRDITGSNALQIWPPLLAQINSMRKRF